MKYKSINFVKLLKNYKSGWVAISSDFQRVVFNGKTLKDTMEKARNYRKQVYYFPAGEKYSNFIGLL